MQQKSANSTRVHTIDIVHSLCRHQCTQTNVSNFFHHPPSEAQQNPRPVSFNHQPALLEINHPQVHPLKKTVALQKKIKTANLKALFHQSMATVKKTQFLPKTLQQMEVLLDCKTEQMNEMLIIGALQLKRNLGIIKPRTLYQSLQGIKSFLEKNPYMATKINKEVIARKAKSSRREANMQPIQQAPLPTLQELQRAISIAPPSEKKIMLIMAKTASRAKETQNAIIHQRVSTHKGNLAIDFHGITKTSDMNNWNIGEHPIVPISKKESSIIERPITKIIPPDRAATAVTKQLKKVNPNLSSYSIRRWAYSTIVDSITTPAQTIVLPIVLKHSEGKHLIPQGAVRYGDTEHRHQLFQKVGATNLLQQLPPLV